MDRALTTKTHMASFLVDHCGPLCRPFRDRHHLGPQGQCQCGRQARRLDRSRFGDGRIDLCDVCRVGRVDCAEWLGDKLYVSFFSPVI